MAELPSQEYLKSRIDYNPETGEARWKPVDESYGPGWNTFNTKYSGKVLSTSAGINGKRYMVSHLLYKLHYGIDCKTLKYKNRDTSDFTILNLENPNETIIDRIKASIPTALNYKSGPKDVHDLISYCPRTGELRWKTRDSKSFNTRFAGTIAGSIGTKGHINIRVYQESFLAHRIAWLLYYGCDPEHYQIDHIDRDKLNNKINNLRLATPSLNSQNKIGFKGYRLHRGKYEAAISVNKIVMSLGAFDTEEEASAAYQAAFEKYKPIYKFTDEEQAMLDNLYNNYPNVTRELQHACHALQVKALNHYTQAIENEI